VEGPVGLHVFFYFYVAVVFILVQEPDSIQAIQTRNEFLEGSGFIEAISLRTSSQNIAFHMRRRRLG